MKNLFISTFSLIFLFSLCIKATAQDVRKNYHVSGTGNVQFMKNAAFDGDSVRLVNKTIFGADQEARATSALVEFVDTSSGVMLPRLTTAQMNAISSPDTGLLIYNMTDSAFYFYENDGWQGVAKSSSVVYEKVLDVVNYQEITTSYLYRYSVTSGIVPDTGDFLYFRTSGFLDYDATTDTVNYLFSLKCSGGSDYLFELDSIEIDVDAGFDIEAIIKRGDDDQTKTGFAKLTFTDGYSGGINGDTLSGVTKTYFKHIRITGSGCSWDSDLLLDFSINDFQDALSIYRTEGVLRFTPYLD